MTATESADVHPNRRLRAAIRSAAWCSSSRRTTSSTRRSAACTSATRATSTGAIPNVPTRTGTATGVTISSSRPANCRCALIPRTSSRSGRQPFLPAHESHARAKREGTAATAIRRPSQARDRRLAGETAMQRDPTGISQRVAVGQKQPSISPMSEMGNHYDGASRLHGRLKGQSNSKDPEIFGRSFHRRVGRCAPALAAECPSRA